MLARSTAYRIGIVLLIRHPVLELGREQEINVWVRGQGPEWKLGMRLSNLDLSVLLAYRVSGNWRGRISLCMAVQDQETAVKANVYLNDLITRARLPAKTQVNIVKSAFRDALSQLPSGDINFFGLPQEFDPAFLHEVLEIVDSSCLFVRDSGDENALA